MKVNNFIKITFVLISSFLLFPSATKADMLYAPIDLFWTPLSLALFIGNLIINFIIFGLAYLFFVNSDTNILKTRKFLIAIFLITLTGFFADSLVFTIFKEFAGQSIVIISFFALSFLIFVSNFLICRFYLKINLRKSIILAICMALLTNPVSYMALSFFITMPLAFFQPHYGRQCIFVADKYCMSGTAYFVIRNICKESVTAGSIAVTRISPIFGSPSATTCCSDDIPPRNTSTYSDTKCGTGKQCMYRFLLPPYQAVEDSVYCS